MKAKKGRYVGGRGLAYICIYIYIYLNIHYILLFLSNPQNACLGFGL